MTVFDTLRAVGITAKITFPTFADGLTNSLSPDDVDARLRWWGQNMLRRAGAEIHVRGLENVPDGEPLVVMSNHRSYYDVPSVYCAVPGRIRMVAKKELFRVPLFGSAMLAAGFIKVDRGKREKAIESLRASKDLLQGGTRVWIAPEGTRSKTGRLGEFKSGGFHIALDANARILPMTITGTEQLLAPDSLIVSPGARVEITLLPPIDAPSYGQARRKELMRDVRDVIASSLGER